VWKNNVVAVFPRLKQGVPVSVAKTPILKNKCNPMWTPVPCWELHSEGICDFIQSAVDIVVDANVSISLNCLKSFKEGMTYMFHFSTQQFLK